jgi:hypothetical protein
MHDPGCMKWQGFSKCIDSLVSLKLSLKNTQQLTIPNILKPQQTHNWSLIQFCSRKKIIEIYLFNYKQLHCQINSSWMQHSLSKRRKEILEGRVMYQNLNFRTFIKQWKCLHSIFWHRSSSWVTGNTIFSFQRLRFSKQREARQLTTSNWTASSWVRRRQIYSVNNS